MSAQIYYHVWSNITDIGYNIYYTFNVQGSASYRELLGIRWRDQLESCVLIASSKIGA